MKKVILALVISVVVCMQIQAQKEANNWAFGQNVGLTWNTTQSLTATGLDGIHYFLVKYLRIKNLLHLFLQR